MDARELQRAGPIARRDERVHHADGDAGVERVESREPAPEFSGSGVVATRGRFARDCLERRARALRNPRPLPLHPTLELVGPIQIEPVEERPCVERRSAVAIAALERVFERLDVARRHSGVQS